MGIFSEGECLREIFSGLFGKIFRARGIFHGGICGGIVCVECLDLHAKLQVPTCSSCDKGQHG